MGWTAKGQVQLPKRKIQFCISHTSNTGVQEIEEQKQKVGSLKTDREAAAKDAAAVLSQLKTAHANDAVHAEVGIITHLGMRSNIGMGCPELIEYSSSSCSCFSVSLEAANLLLLFFYLLHNRVEVREIQSCPFFFGICT